MIEVIGETGNAEHDAALLMRDALVRTWPGIEASPAEEDHIKVASRVKLSGQKVSDIDVVVVGLLRSRRYIVPRANTKDADGKSIVGSKVRVRSFVIAVEVKDQSGPNVVVEAGGVRVRYKDGWKSATEQNESQRYALVNYLRDCTNTNPWVHRCLVLRGLNELPKVRGIPQPTAGAVPATFDATALLVATASVNGIKKYAQEHAISSGDDATIERILDDGFLKPLVASGLDRKRMDRIAARPDEARQLSSLLGKQRVHLRGNGGTGKTILLLQSAYDAFLDRGMRSLVLTYNTALAADIQRTLAQMGIPSDGEAGGITVRTVMSFMYSWLHRLGLAPNEGSFREYEGKCAEALRYIEQGAIGDAEIEAVKAENPTEFGFDAILVDEAQDWPQPEADLLARLHGGNAISLADGLSQLVRGAATNWKSPLQSIASIESRSLRDGLRMKASLCRFANAVAEEGGFQWPVSPNKLAPGGRVIVSGNRYSGNRSLQRQILAGALEARNMPVDLLHCVPPSGVSDINGKRRSDLATAFEANGWETWDAVDEVVRRSFPRSAEALRIVQYESCRGLEGWSTVLDGLDEFWDLRRSMALTASKPTNPGIDPEIEADVAAWRWSMIPITRSIDTLVITLRSKESKVGKVLSSVARAMPDTIEFVD